jgi:hypothetical protein
MPTTATDRVGLPNPDLIIATTEFTPRGRGATAAAAPAGVARYRIITTKEVDAYEPPLAAAEVEIFGLNRLKAPGDKFAGTERKAAKLSISTAAIEKFADVSSLLASLPTKDPKGVSKAAGSRRIPEEQRNIRVRAFLYAASREDDNDFHLIVGDDPAAAAPKLMTMEISGLPPSSSASFARLKAARSAYKDFFSGDLPGLGYDHYPKRIPVEIEGSLFFDASHQIGTPPGPKKLRPFMPRIWEVHPISKIVFEP